MTDAINIILDESKHPDVCFVEIETDDSRSISIGERIKDQGYIKIRITADDIKNLPKDWPL